MITLAIICNWTQYQHRHRLFYIGFISYIFFIDDAWDYILLIRLLPKSLIKMELILAQVYFTLMFSLHDIFCEIQGTLYLNSSICS